MMQFSICIKKVVKGIAIGSADFLLNGKSRTINWNAFLTKEKQALQIEFVEVSKGALADMSDAVGQSLARELRNCLQLKLPSEFFKG